MKRYRKFRRTIQAVKWTRLAMDVFGVLYALTFFLAPMAVLYAALKLARSL